MKRKVHISFTDPLKSRFIMFKREQYFLKLCRYVKDFLTSLIELSWIWTIFWFSASFFLSWLFFAVIWYLIAMVHGKREILFV